MFAHVRVFASSPGRKDRTAASAAAYSYLLVAKGSTKTIRMSLSREQPPARVERAQQEQDYAASRSGHAGCRLFFFRSKRECGGLKPLPEVRAGFCANTRTWGVRPCSRVRKAGFIRPRMQNADSAHTLHLRLHFITHITWVSAPCNGCNAVKRHTPFPII